MPSITVDIIVYTKNYSHFLFIQRKNEPFKGHLAFPGGFLDMKERIVDSAKRELLEETTIDVDVENLQSFKVLDEPERDPRSRVVSHVFGVEVTVDQAKSAKAADDASELIWIPFQKVVELLESDHPIAFDHRQTLIEFIQDVILKNSFLQMGEANSKKS
jgi:ADP-ribose pyrophosphatase YjhB (NUDIX family)